MSANAKRRRRDMRNSFESKGMGACRRAGSSTAEVALVFDDLSQYRRQLAGFRSRRRGRQSGVKPLGWRRAVARLQHDGHRVRDERCDEQRGRPARRRRVLGGVRTAAPAHARRKGAATTAGTIVRVQGAGSLRRENLHPALRPKSARSARRVAGARSDRPRKGPPPFRGP